MLLLTIDNVTLGELAKWGAGLLALGGTIVGIIAGIKKVLRALFKESLDEIGKRFDKIEKRLDSVDLESCKNFLVSVLDELDREGALDEILRMRFYEQYEHYAKMGGNTYIQARVDELKTAGKL